MTKTTQKKTKPEQELSVQEIAALWKASRWTVVRTMTKNGFAGRKNAPGRGSRRTFLEADVELVNFKRIAAAGRAK